MILSTTTPGSAKKGIERDGECRIVVVGDGWQFLDDASADIAERRRPQIEDAVLVSEKVLLGAQEAPKVNLLFHRQASALPVDLRKRDDGTFLRDQCRLKAIKRLRKGQVVRDRDKLSNDVAAMIVYQLDDVASRKFGLLVRASDFLIERNGF